MLAALIAFLSMGTDLTDILFIILVFFVAWSPSLRQASSHFIRAALDSARVMILLHVTSRGFCLTLAILICNSCSVHLGHGLPDYGVLSSHHILLVINASNILLSLPLGSFLGSSWSLQLSSLLVRNGRC